MVATSTNCYFQIRGFRAFKGSTRKPQPSSTAQQGNPCLSKYTRRRSLMVLLTSPLTTKETLGFMFLTHGQYNLLVNDPSGFCVPHQPTFLLSLRHHGMKARALLCPRQLLLQCTSARGTLCTAGEVPAPTSRHLRERAVGILPLGNPSI